MLGRGVVGCRKLDDDSDERAGARGAWEVAWIAFTMTTPTNFN
jgi:hypothetical protein